MRTLRRAAIAAALSATTAAAQGTTAIGSPPPGSDSLYALAVDPAAYKDDGAIYLLDEGVYRYEMDGTGSRTLRMVVQILKESSVSRYREFQFSFNGATQTFSLDWMRVVKPTGEVISAAPAQVQDGNLPAALANPIYNDTRIKRVSLSGVEVGTIVDYSYTITTTKAYLPPDFLTSWLINGSLPARRSRLVLDVPAAMQPRIKEENLKFKRQEVTANGRTRYTWATTEVVVPEFESFAADSDTVIVNVQMSSPLGWTDIGKWFAGLAKDRYTLTPAVERKIAEVVGGARTLDDSIRAVHKWVAQDIRYVSISLGLGGYQPRTPAEVLESGFGDCKDKAMLFIAALARMGVTAFPVLLSNTADADRAMPALNQFNHAIAAVRRRDRSYEYVDLTAAYTPYGRLPRAEQGGFALIVQPDGRTEEVMLPQDSVGVAQVKFHISGTVSDSGIFTGRFEERRSGGAEEAMRSAFSTPVDSARRANLQRSLAARYFPGATGDSVVVFAGKDFASEPRLTVLIRNGRATSRSGGTEILNNPLVASPTSSAAILQQAATQLVARLETAGPRQFPINASAVFGTDHESTVIELTLPEGWRVRLPAGVDIANEFGRYRSSYTQDGRVLRIVRENVGARGTLPPERIEQLKTLLRAVASDDVRFFLVDKEP